VREKRHGDRTYFNKNMRLEVTNVCVASCLFCSFAKLEEGAPGSHTMKLEEAWRELESKVRAYLESLGEVGLTREYDYRLLNGQASRSVFWHMLQHVVNHATYHRGQITTMLRQVGAKPPQPTDLIAYYRTLSVQQG